MPLKRRAAFHDRRRLRCGYGAVSCAWWSASRPTIASREVRYDRNQEEGALLGERVPLDNMILEVVDMDRHRVDRLLLLRPEPPQEPVG